MLWLKDTFSLNDWYNFQTFILTFSLKFFKICYTRYQKWIDQLKSLKVQEIKLFSNHFIRLSNGQILYTIT